MHRRLVSSVFLLLTSYTTVSCNDTKSQTYAPFAPFGVSPVCAVDEPTAVVAARSRLQCANQCSQKSWCTVHQLNEDMKQCQLYDFIPLNYTESSQCTAFRSNLPPTVEAVEAEQCSFPFTSGGKLYYTCAINNNNEVPNNVWCPLLPPTNTPAVCSYTAYGFVAQNLTVSVPIPATAVSLRSVNRWLTILSRVDVNFPTSGVNYVDGFGNIESNFWLGLSRIHLLTNPTVNGGRTYRLRVEMYLINQARWISQEYDSFTLGNSGTSYQLQVSQTATGDAEDAINYASAPANSKPFATTGTDCTSVHGPFWYTSFGNCCRTKWFGVYGTGFQWMSPNGKLSVLRAMVKLIN